MNDMEIDLFAETTYGKIALRKIKEQAVISNDFRLYMAEWLNDKKGAYGCMRLFGAEFERPTRGKNKGKLTKIIQHSKQVVYVTAKEMKDFEEKLCLV